MLYACDLKWWDAYHAETADFPGERWTQDEQAAKKYGLRWVRGSVGYDLSLDPERIHYGGNSGFQCLNMAVLAGASRVILTGYDMGHLGGRAHWHPDHPGGMHNPSEGQCARWREAFATAARQLADLPVEVINCSRHTRLDCFPKAKLEDVL